MHRINVVKLLAQEDSITQQEILEAIAKNPNIRQQDLWNSHPSITKDAGKIKALYQKGYITRAYCKHSWRLQITKTGLEALKSNKNMIIT